MLNNAMSEYINTGQKLLKSPKDETKFFPPILFHSSIEKGVAWKKYENNRDASEADCQFTMHLKLV